MPELHPHHLTFQGGLHVGTRGVNLEEAGAHIPADTLFSALVVTWQLLGGDPANFVAPFLAQDPPFLLTSAFPFAGAVRFFPLPLDRRRLFSKAGWSSIRERGKSLKSIRFLSQGLVERLLAGDPLDTWLFPDAEQEEPQTGVALQGGILWLTKAEVASLPQAMQNDKKRPRPLRSLRYQSVWKESRVPRVTVDRVNSASNIFHVGRVRFAPGCGLWFGVHWRTPDATIGHAGPTFKKALDRCLAALADSGLGGERTAGYGQFRLIDEKRPISLADPTSGSAAWLLSRYLPAGAQETTAALAHPEAAYNLIALRGWAQSDGNPDQRRKSVTMLEEGSLVGWPDGPAPGRVVDLRPTYQNPAGDLPHPVYRYGLGLALGLPGPKEANHV